MDIATAKAEATTRAGLPHTAQLNPPRLFDRLIIPQKPYNFQVGI